LLISHFHADHFGGVMELEQIIPIGTILDHGAEAQKALSKPKLLKLILAYEKVREQSHFNLALPSSTTVLQK
jgi:glyoxylase-like metal-dependent hydrolase (beta-lactamase superfamily II)